MSENLEQRVLEWKERILHLKVEASLEITDDLNDEPSKWIDGEHVKRKMGID